LADAAIRVSSAQPGRRNFVAVSEGAVRVRVRLTPKSAAEGVEGIEETIDGPALMVRVRAVPEKGKANAALVSVFADWLGVARSSVDVAAGGKSRCKMLAVTGDGPRLAARIAARLAASR
jgi:uncharacterized protein YggU (UPF0235/DUF167 family)